MFPLMLVKATPLTKGNMPEFNKQELLNFKFWPIRALKIIRSTRFAATWMENEDK